MKNLMNKWQTVTLNDICEFIKDGTHQTPTYAEDGFIFLSSKNVTTGVVDWEDVKYIPEDLHEKLYKALSPQINDILLAKNGTTGVAAIVDKDIIFDVYVSLAVLRPNTSIISPRFLLWAVNSPHSKIQFNQSLKGIGVPNLHLSSISKTTITLPPLDIQNYIVSVLDKLQSIIIHRKQQLSKLDELVKARFVEMFGEPNLNPMGWEESHLSEKLDVLGGYAFKSDEFDEETGIPVLRIGNINAGFFRPVNMVYWREDENLEKYAMYPGDLVMSLTGTVGKDDYGNVCILGNDYDKYYLNQRNAKLEIKEGLDKLYLSEILKFDTIKKRLTGISRGVRQANISNRDILNLYIPIPPLDLQNQFATFVEQTDKSKFLNENVTRLLRRVKLYDQF